MKNFVMHAQRSWTSIYILTIITYFVSHGLMLTVYGAWWDDMLIWNVSQETFEEFQGPNSFNNPFLYYTIKNINNISSTQLRMFVFRIVPFLCWLISLTCFYSIVKQVTLDKTYTLYSSLFAASCGLNKCMVLICCYHYTISIMLFMIGLVFYVKDYYKSCMGYRILTALLWLFSLLIWRTAVLVVPFLIVFTSTLKVEYKRNKIVYLKELASFLIRRYWSVLLALIFFTILYTTILSPKGVYASYYSLSFKNIILSPITTLSCCFSIIINYITSLLNILASAGLSGLKRIIAILMIVGVLFLITFHKNKPIVPKTAFLWVCIAIFYFSIMPQLLIDSYYAINIDGYKSRISALSVYPISLIIGFFVCRTSFTARTVIGSFIVCLSMVYSVTTYLNYSKGWAKNEALCTIFQNHNLNGKKIRIIDNSQTYNPFVSEIYRYYDYEGCARLAYGVYSKTRCIDYYDQDVMRNFIKPDYYLYIDVKEKSPFSIWGYIVNRYFNKIEYNRIINNMLMYRLVTNEEFNNLYPQCAISIK